MNSSVLLAYKERSLHLCVRPIENFIITQILFPVLYYILAFYPNFYVDSVSLCEALCVC